MTPALYPFQRLAVAQTLNRDVPVIVICPTGGGKTIIASKIIERMDASMVLFMAHRRELVHQAQGKLRMFGISAGVILAGEARDHMRRVQVASIQTLHSRCIRRGEELPPAQLVVIDECHHATAATWRAIIGRFPEAKIIGLTATPCRRDGHGLGGMFECFVECPQIDELIRLGHLVKTKVYAPTTPDLKGVRVRHGDYIEQQLAERMDKADLVGDIVSHWHRLADRRPTIVFAVSVGHSVHLCGEFQKSGVRAEHIDGTTPKEERDAILARLATGDLELVSNCMVLTEGWDCPAVSCAVLARPTKSMGLYLQMAGRVLRPAPGKDHALILDHAGSTYLHGFVEDQREWTLDPERRAANLTAAAHTRAGDRLTECSQCGAIRTAGRPCDHCGHMPRRRPDYVPVRDGELHQLDRNGLRPHQYSPEQRRQFHAMLAHIALERNYKLGWAAHKFRERFGHWPDARHVAPMPPSPEVRSWVRSRQIAYAKAMANA